MSKKKHDHVWEYKWKDFGVCKVCNAEIVQNTNGDWNIFIWA